MNENIGIFCVVSDRNLSDDEIVLGTAFAIKIFEDKKYYLLTAYHVISELIAKNQHVIVKDEAGRYYDAEKIFPSVLSNEYRTFGQDFAVFIIHSDINYQTYEIMDYDKRTSCFVRGSIPHYTTIFTSINGNILGQESIAGQKKVLQLTLDTKQIFDKNDKPISEQHILRGLSGAPVLVEMNGKEVCVGVLANLERDQAGSVKYAVLMKTIVEECLNPLHITYDLFEGQKSTGNLLQDDEAFIELAIENTEDFIFAEESLEQKAWNKISDLFYKGVQVDILLKHAIESEIFLRYSAEVKCAILYFYARILLKRNKKDSAFQMFNKISSMFLNVSQQSKMKLNALITSRSAIEREIKIPGETLRSIRYGGDKISCLSNTSNEFISYELASMYGRGLTNVFSCNMDFSTQDKEEILKIYTFHENLLKSNPEQLCKQDVVNTSLQWYLGYWRINTEFDLQRMDVAVRNGFRQSKKRKNNIFYIQSMMSYGIMKAFDNKNIDAVKILLLSVKLMYDTKVRLIHEGIRQLLVILEEENLVLYAMVKLAYETQMDERFLKKIELYKIDLGIYSWENILQQVNELYELKFYNNMNIYNVDFDDLEIFF